MTAGTEGGKKNCFAYSSVVSNGQEAKEIHFTRQKLVTKSTFFQNFVVVKKKSQSVFGSKGAKRKRGTRTKKFVPTLDLHAQEGGRICTNILNHN